MAAMLGALPLFVVLLLLSLPRVWAHIPFIKSTDITRVWWFSNAFLALGIGAFLERFMKHELSKRIVVIALMAVALTLVTILAWRALCGAGVTVFGRCGPQDLVEPLYLWGMLWAFLSFLIYLLYDRVTAWGTLFIFLAFILAIIPNPIVALNLKEPRCRGSHYFALKEHGAFEPEAVLATMEPGYRLASEEVSWEGHDLTAIFGHVLGSNGRSIIMDKQFTDYLLSKKLIVVDDRLGGYHFTSPWQTKELERLAIRYVFAAKTAPELKNAGWRILAKHGGRVLYEDPLKPSPFYLLQNSAQTFLRGYRFTGNSAEIILPEIENPSTLIGAFVARAGWRVTVDGKPRAWEAGQDRLIQIPLKPMDRVVTLTYFSL